MIETTNNGELHAEVTSLKADLIRVRKDLTDMASTLLERGRRSVRSAGHDVRQRVDDSLQGVQDYVKDRPFTSTLMALGAGLLIGTLIRRK